jgi:sugar phosphate isomerase/epimerase
MDQLLGLDLGVIEILDDLNDRLNGSRIKRLKEIKESRDIIYTIHSPILDMNIASANDRFRSLSMKFVTTSIDHAREIDARLVVVHPGNHSPLEYLHPRIHWDTNMESIGRLIKYAEDLGVGVGIENMPCNTPMMLQKASEFQALADAGLQVPITLDVGHANTTGQLQAFLDSMAPQIVHVHLHDNRGSADEHLAIGKGNVDWNLIRSRLSFEKITGIIECNTLSDAAASLSQMHRLYKK